MSVLILSENLPTISDVHLTSLLNDSAVRNELRISSEQAQIIDRALLAFRSKQREFSRKTARLPREQRADIDRKTHFKLSEELKIEISTLLNGTQLKRFVEIHIQVCGATAFTVRAIQDALELTDEQRANFKNLVAEMDGALKQITSNTTEEVTKLTNEERRLKAFGHEKEERQRMADQWKRSFQKAYSLLSEPQRATWKTLVGEPFERADFGPYRRPVN